MKRYTYYFIPLIILFIFAYDAFVYIKSGQEATVSYVIIAEWSRDYPAFTFLIGFVMGHLFWGLYKERK